MFRQKLLLGVLFAAATLVGCKNSQVSTDGGPTGPFSLAWSEYPSWSVFGVAHEKGLIDKAKGKRGRMEEKWGVDIVLVQQEYDPCITSYGTNTVDAVCITNMDALAPSLSRESVAVLPTSTSDGADACIAVGIDNVDQLAGKESHGLEKSVSQYLFERGLEQLGKDPSGFPFKQMDPGAAAQAMQQNNESIQSIVVWNPFALQTLRTREGDAKVLFDSTLIPEEIVDMVVVGKDVLQRPGGEAFVSALIETFYEVNQMLASSSEGDSTLVALGEKFSNLGLADMKIVVQQTKFYKTPEEAIGLFEKDSFRQETMPRVVEFCATHDMVPQKPVIGFDNPDAQLNFTTKYIKFVARDLEAGGDAAANAGSGANE